MSTHEEDDHNMDEPPGDANHEEPTEAVGSNGGRTSEGLIELEAMHRAYAALAVLPVATRPRAAAWVIESLGIKEFRPGVPPLRTTRVVNSSSQPNSVIVEHKPSPREFMHQKKPSSHVERIACLAYYLTHYRETPHIKSSDLAQLNIEAAWQKFGNISRDIDNADRQSGYVVTAGNGAKQLTVRGEAVVNALPSREEVKTAQEEHPYRAKRPANRSRNTTAADEDDQ